MTEYNIFSENIYQGWEIDEKYFIDKAREILKYYLNMPEIAKSCCLKDYEYKTI